MNVNPVILAIAAAFWTLIVTVIGWRVGNSHAKSREAANRRRGFIALLTRWRLEIKERAPSSGSFPTQDYCVAAYKCKLAHFEEQIALVNPDFADQDQFVLLTESVKALNNKQIGHELNETTILNTLDDLIEFVKSK